MSFRCPNPNCLKDFPTSRAAFVHLGNSTKCKSWEKISISRRFEETSDSEDTESTPDVTVVKLPWRKIKPLPERAPKFEFQVPIIPEDQAPTDRGETNGETSAPLESASHLPPTTPSVQPSRVIDEHPNAGYAFGSGQTILDQIREDPQRQENMFHPFRDSDDFEMGAWLIQSGISMAEIDNFLKLPWVKKHGRFSFRSAKELHKQIALLPQPPAWKEREIHVEGGTTRKPIKLRFRHAIEVFRFLYGNPTYADFQENAPYVLWEDDEKTAELFQEPHSGTLSWEIQVGEGETLGLVMLASDKTHLNNCYGNKQLHGVYLSVGNIKSSLRTKGSARCWMMVAQIPVAKFDQKDYQGILSQRLYHQCMDIVMESLKACSRNPERMTDATGVVRLVRTILWAHLADYPEQQLIACASGSSSPVTLAIYNTFGRETRRGPRTGAVTMQRIRTLLKTKNLSTTKFRRYITLARKKQLNGVYEPFWRDWKFSDPHNFLVPDALHQWHRFFFDHIMSWTRILMSDRQVDARYSRLQKHIGYRQFINGFTSHSQHTGREHRDLQRDFIAVIAGHEKMTVPVIAAFRSLLEFIYVAQFPIQSQKSLAFMETSLNLFHKHKGAVSATGVRDGKYKKGKFNIKKLELMLGICASTRSVGSALQYSTDQSESLHISMAKVPYRATNKKDFEIQMCRFDDRREKLRLLTLFVENEKHRKLKASKVDSQGNHTGGPARDASGSTPGSGVPANEFAKMFLPPPIRNAFDKDDAPRNTTTAFLLTDRITYGNMKISEVAQMYRLPKLQRLVRGFFGKRKLLLDCWNRVRLQMRSVSQSGTVLPPAVVMAAPPSKQYWRGFCNFVMVKDAATYGIAGIKGHFVAQVRLVFTPLFASETEMSAHGNEYFAYVEPLEPPPDSLIDGVHVPDDGVGLFRVKRSHAADKSRNGLIINLKDIWRPIDLVPKFGKKCPRKWDSSLAGETAMQFFVNHFFDKETFEAFMF